MLRGKQYQDVIAGQLTAMKAMTSTEALMPNINISHTSVSLAPIIIEQTYQLQSGAFAPLARTTTEIAVHTSLQASNKS